MLRFRISTVMLSVSLIAVGFAWQRDHQALLRKFREVNPPISYYSEKHGYWSPSSHLNQRDTAYYENALAGDATFEGKMIESSQGMGSPALRQPTRATLDATIALLDDSTPMVAQNAAELLALYLQALSGSENIDVESIEIRAYFGAVGVQRTYELLKSESAKMRAAGALILGNTLYSRETERRLINAFDVEVDSGVKWHLAWAYWALGNNYDRAGWYFQNRAATNASSATEQ